MIHIEEKIDNTPHTDTTDTHCGQVLEQWGPRLRLCRKRSRTKCCPHRAQLLASLQQHPLVLVLPDSVPWLHLGGKQKVVLCILMT